MEIKVTLPWDKKTLEGCPFRYSDSEGYDDDCCSIMNFKTENFEYCSDNNKFPEWCPLLKGSVTVKR